MGGEGAIRSMESVNRVLQSATIAEVTRLERSLGWLATTANASPFIGLFGTVVGIVIAFQGLSAATASSIQSVAPGIAEALIATAAGIAAAVPAAIFYNYFLKQGEIAHGDDGPFCAGAVKPYRASLHQSRCLGCNSVLR